MYSLKRALFISLLCLSGAFFSYSKTLPSENIKAGLHALWDPPLYLGAGTVLGAACLMSSITWGACKVIPGTTSFGQECFLFSRILGIASWNSFTYALKRSPLVSFLFQRIPPSCSAWDANQDMLAKIPVSTEKDKELVQFLQKRWLAKTTGCYRFLVDWGLAPFGIAHQLHPESTNSYARDPSNRLYKTYVLRVDSWKHRLPHPFHFPLILTRHCPIQNYLPNCISVDSQESFCERLSSLLSTARPFAIVDATSWFSLKENAKEWQAIWEKKQKQLLEQCHAHNLDTTKIICIERRDLELHGGIRVLPFPTTPEDARIKQFEHLLEWVSKFGLSANRIELDRTLTQAPFSCSQKQAADKEQIQQLFCSLEESWSSDHPQKTILFKGTMQILKDLWAHLSEEKWEEVLCSPTRFHLAQLALKKIEQKLRFLIEEDAHLSFHDATEHLEQVHADLTSLIEIFSSFTKDDFAAIFQAHQTCIPEELRSFAQYGIHSSGMTCMGGIFRAVEKAVGRKPRILCGENTYFECLYTSELFGKPLSILQATEEDFKEADLLLSQFNPTLKRIDITSEDFHNAEYHVEKIADVLHKALLLREGKPFTIAIDCTFDFSDSSRVNAVLLKFQQEILSGVLNVICYRSGIKYDLFGMDNYCGGPYFIVHNQDPRWRTFDDLLTDPALQTDRLSLSWFCLAFQHAAPYLEAYRKQIFDNTHAVLAKIPQSLTSSHNSKYRVIPMESDTDPTFIDIKIFGSQHELRGNLLVGGLLTIKALQAGFPFLYRPGIGFFHPNISIIYGNVCTTVRLTLGLDPAQIDVFADCLRDIDALNSRI